MSERPFVLGLTGSIGMGKSTVARMIREEGIPVWDADGAVHRLYARGGAGVTQIEALRPEAVREGKVSRPALRAWIAEDPGALERIEKAIHPLVAADRADFLAGADAADEPLVVLDIPLLFETGGEHYVDAVLVVTAPPELQRERVLARPGITEADLERMLAKQMSDAEKRARADYIIQSIELEATRQSVRALIRHLRERNGHA